MNLILFGFKRCGKTHFGKRLARKLYRSFVDTDHLIEDLHEKASGKHISCREIALEKGDAYFRTLENEAIASLSKYDNVIISVGGGAILNPINQEILAKIGKLVYLDVKKEVLKQRMLSGLLASYLDPEDPEGSFETMYAARKPLYDQVPAIRIIMEGRSEAEILDQLEQEVKNG